MRRLFLSLDYHRIMQKLFSRDGASLHRAPRRHKRRLRGESLESRQLLAGDAFHHNVFDPEDVNDDGQVTAGDALAIINGMQLKSIGDITGFTDVNNDGRRTSADALQVINRMNRDFGRDQGLDRRDSHPSTTANPTPSAPEEVRLIDGTNNNLENPTLGTTATPLLRVADADYADGISTPAGEDRPSPRDISNLLSSADEEGTRSDRNLSAFIYVWGQFLDHDIDLSESQETGGESFDIEVPATDSLFDPNGTGSVTIPLLRSVFDSETGTSIDNPRQQINAVTSYIDGSMVYGSDQATADGLRSFEGGRLFVSEDGLLLPDDENGVLAGDIRAAENLSLTALQTLFVREHNQWADRIAQENPDLTDEQIYQQARAIVVAEIQSITFNEFLPALLGQRAISRYDGYDSTVDPSIANEFSTAAFRFGHSTLNDDIEFFGNDGRAVREEVSLAEAFFNPSLLEKTGIDSLLKYEASTQAQEVDLEVVDSLRNLLFGPAGVGGMDLVALNIQRGRDHGLADYNTTREAYGLDPVESFADITDDEELQGKLQTLYGDVNNIDLWVGLLAEDHLQGSSVGELTQTIIVDQFERLRDGDRFWYENTFSGRELRSIQQTSLADVIERNTTVEGLQDNVFFMRAEVRGTVLAVPSAPVAATNSVAKNSRPLDNRDRNQPRDSGRPVGVEGITIELLNDNGDVIDSTTTNARGEYRFRSFVETGDYQIRVAADQGLELESEDPIDVLISAGDVRLRDLNFRVVV